MNAAIIQARMGSTRLPGKVMMDICGKPALQRVIDRVSAAELVDQVIVATTINSHEIITYCKDNKINCFVGDEDDVLLRVLRAAQKFKVECIIDITADCPLIDPEIIDQCVALFNNNPLIDYVSNCVPYRSYPDGLDVQVYTTEALQYEELRARNKKKRTHVGYNIGTNHNHFDIVCIPAPKGLHWPDLRITLDTEEDLKLIRLIYQYFLDNADSYGPQFSAYDIIEFLKRNPQLLEINQDIKPKRPEEK